MSPYAELLDTSVVAPRDRPEYWSAGIAKRFFPMRVDAVSAPTFDARLVGGRIGPVAVGSIQGRPHRVVRTSAQISAGDPECILLYLLVRGAVRIEQEDRSCVLRPGDLACHDTSRPSVFEGQRAFEVLLFSVPRWFIGARSENIARHSATRAAGAGAPLARLGAPFLASLARAATDGDGLPDNDGEAAAEMILPRAAPRLRRRRTLRIAHAVQSASHPPAAIRRREPARPRSRPGAASERPLPVDALCAQALRGIRVRGVGVDPRSPTRGRDRRASRIRRCHRRRGRAMGLPQPDELQSGISRKVRLRAERRPPRALVGVRRPARITCGQGASCLASGLREAGLSHPCAPDAGLSGRDDAVRVERVLDRLIESAKGVVVEPELIRREVHE